ncbi:RNA polymerase sigma factor RpoD/SigA [Nannocystis pusilla]|uniref:RNA polymerase sigma factor RpoD/SigA n=1 Tax=Nannocystis pusilla TaxID=889268 RepID=UPI003B7BC6B8
MPKNVREADQSQVAGHEFDITRSYFREIAEATEVMSPEEEMALAKRIRQLREERWSAMLAYLPLVAVIMALAEARAQLPGDKAAELGGCARRLRDRWTAQDEQAFREARLRVAPVVCDLDPDDELANTICADLLALSAGHRDLIALKPNRPPRRTQVFTGYVDKIATISSDLSAAKQRFVTSNLRLVVSVARRYAKAQLTLHDLIQEGNIGLMKAVDRFDHRRGFRFSTYGSWWIRHAIQRAIADKGRQVRLPVHVAELQRRMTKACREFEKLHGVPATDADLAFVLKLDLEKVSRLRAIPADAVHLDQPVGDGRGTLADCLVAPDDRGADALDARRIFAVVEECLKCSPRSRRAFCGFAQVSMRRSKS